MSIYMDNAATTKIADEVLENMLPYLKNEYGNPSSIYTLGQKAKGAIENSRRTIANSLNIKEKEIFFTSGGTEADNWAIRSVAHSLKNKGKHIITSKIEHHAVLSPMEFLETLGYEITYLNVDENGFISLDDLRKTIKKETILISIMFANNEIGTIEPIKEISEIAHENNILFHSDAVQALGNINMNIKELNVDLMSFSGHKINGPKGIGFLYINENTKLNPLIFGGPQERKLRAGTENVAGIVGIGKAVELATKNIDDKIIKIKNLRDNLLNKLLKINGIYLNGSINNRLCGNINISIEDINIEELLMLLDFENIYASSGSACTSGSLNPSHVLLSIGKNVNLSKNCLRLSLGNQNTLNEIDIVYNKIKRIIEKLRN